MTKFGESLTNLRSLQLEGLRRTPLGWQQVQRDGTLEVGQKRRDGGQALTAGRRTWRVQGQAACARRGALAPGPQLRPHTGRCHVFTVALALGRHVLSPSEARAAAAGGQVPGPVRGREWLCEEGTRPLHEQPRRRDHRCRVQRAAAGGRGPAPKTKPRSKLVD
jgi:hypothetical protein